MDPSLHLGNQSIDEFLNWELDNGPRLEIIDPHRKSVDVHSNCESEDHIYVNHHNSTTSSRGDSGYLIDVVDPSWRHTRTKCDAYPTHNTSSNFTNVSSSNNSNSVMDRFSNTPTSPPGDMCCVSEVVRNFMKGVDDARKFLPSGSEMLGMNSLLVQNSKEGENRVDNDEAEIRSSRFEARGKKNQHPEENDCDEERSNKKLPVVDTEPNVPVEEFDDVWIYTLDGRDKKLAAYISDLQIAGSKTTQQGGQVEESSSGAKGGRCKRNREIQVIDLTSLLIECAQSVSAGDHHTANELLKQIRQHSSRFGSGLQRLGHYFADGLEARLAGTGSEIYKSLVRRRGAFPDNLKAYCMVHVLSSFRKISDFASNQLIMIKSEKAMRVHIIDFGISYGFQWPVFIRRVAEREGGPPMLRITGIDFPQSGSRPAEMVEDMGRWLANYAKTFNVPFEYYAIAKNWETIQIEDLKIEKGEFVAVTCSIRAMNLTESSRTMVLDLIRRINPDFFIHGVVNGAYNSPFFVPRFLEVLSHYSAIFDMMETILPGDKPERMLIERGKFGKEILNVIACEGRERVERPETYRQWQRRHLRAGFMQVPFERKLMDTITYKVRNFYHRDIVMVEEDCWLLMSWKGRIIYAMSCWQPV